MKYTTFLILFPSLYLFQKHVYSIGIVKGSSMKPSFNPSSSRDGNDIVLLNRNYLPLRHGDVIFIKNPYKENQVLVKRVVGLPGDYMTTQIPIQESHMECIQYDLVNKPQPDSHAWIEIPPGHVWIESDSKGKDSLTLGPIPMGLIQGRVECILWPWNRVGTGSFHNYSKENIEFRIMKKADLLELFH